MTWISEAKWPYPQVNLGNTGNISTDKHETKGHAFDVIEMLQTYGFGGDGEIFPIETRVYNDEDE